MTATTTDIVVPADLWDTDDEGVLFLWVYPDGTVVEKGKLVGMVCARDALDPELEEFVCEESRRESFR